MLELALVADDMTGAADSGVPFAAALSPVWLVDHRRLAAAAEPGAGAPRALAVFTATRGLEPGEAGRVLAQVGRRLAALRPARVFKKIDSTLRGNIGAELDALMEALGRRPSFIAPAYPAEGRTTVGGVHRLHGVPVAQTEIGRDPLAPVGDSRIDRWIGRQTPHACAHIELGVLEAGAAAAAAEIDRRLAAGVRHLTFDAATDAHLSAVVALARARYPRALLCGAAGLSRCLAAALSGGAPPPGIRRAPAVPPGGGGFLFVCGSASAVLRRQVDELRAAAPAALEELAVETLIAGPSGAPWAAALGRAAASLGGGPVVLRLAARDPGGAEVDPRALTDALGRFAAALAARRRPAGLFLSGGDTAAAVLAAAEFRGVRLEGELDGGVVWGTVLGGALDGLPVATKAGAFGAPDALRRLFAALPPRGGGER